VALNWRLQWKKSMDGIHLWGRGRKEGFLDSYWEILNEIWVSHPHSSLIAFRISMAVLQIRISDTDPGERKTLHPRQEGCLRMVLHRFPEDSAPRAAKLYNQGRPMCQRENSTPCQ
jgi:hypothetical protein